VLYRLAESAYSPAEEEAITPEIGGLSCTSQSALSPTGCLLLAQSKHPTVTRQCPLSGVKRTSMGSNPMSAFDPTRNIDREKILDSDKITI
jgi:hypothetical protein